MSGALGEIELADILAEISFARRLDAVAAVAEIEGVEIRLKDSILAVMLFKIQSALYLLELSDNRDLLVVGQVFDELLGYRRAAAAGKSCCRAEGTQPVDAVILFKALSSRQMKAFLRFSGILSESTQIRFSSPWS